MNWASEKPLRKVTLNLFAEDVEYMEKTGTGWTQMVRDAVHHFVTSRRTLSTLQRLEDEYDR